MATKIKIALFSSFTWILTTLFAGQVLGANIQTEYFSLSIPEGWTCDPNQNFFICTELTPTTGKSAVVVINYGELGLNDTMEQYRRLLRSPRTQTLASGTSLVSRVISFQEKSISGQNWVEGLHFEGELAEYYTYYLATTNQSHSYLVSLSAHKDDWEIYRPQFEGVISSLRVYESHSPQGTVEDKAFETDSTNDLRADNQVSSPLPDISQKLSLSHVFLFVAIAAFGLVLLYALRG